MLLTIKTKTMVLTLDLGNEPITKVVSDEPEENGGGSDEDVEEIETTDVFDLVSKCCGDRVIQRGGDEGTNHYECMKYGDACDVTDKDDWKPKAKPEKKQRKSRTFAEKPCCGSKGPRHKAGCVNAGAGTNPDMIDFECDACNKVFEGKRGSAQTCPECGEKDNIWPKK